VIDIGVNLTNSRFHQDIDDVLLRAKNAGLTQLIITGTSVKESQSALALCHKFPDYLSCTAGVHPHDADGVGVNFIDQLSDLAKHEYVKAIGECGLDFNRNFSTPENQKAIFEQQIRLASQLSKPLFLHQRDAFEPWLAMLKPYVDKIPAMITHCFTGDSNELKICIDHGMYIGITGWVCDERRGMPLQEAVKKLPLDRLLIETDAPYLTPRNIRPKPKSSRNEPSYLPFIVKKVAELTERSEDEIIAQSRVNTKKVFQL